MSIFKAFAPEKPETWPRQKGGEKLLPGTFSSPVILSWGRQYEVVRLVLGGNGSDLWWESVDGESWTVEPGLDQSWHPLPTPDDGMVMVPEKLKGKHWHWWFGHRLRSGEPQARAVTWASVVNHFKEADR